MTTPTDYQIQLARLVEVVERLRAPDGCPWDREQTIDTLKPFVLEETYEVLDAIDRGDHDALCEELGDFMFEAVFLAQLEREAGRFTIADSLQRIADKLIRRHPHVFARSHDEPALEHASQVRKRWEEIKREEVKDKVRGGAKPKTLLSGLPKALPALLRAYHTSVRAASVGFDWATPGDVLEKIQEEVDEVREAVTSGAGQARVEEEVGDLLFAIANLARKLGVEPETALRKANEKFTGRFTAMEQSIEQSGRTMSRMTLEEMEREWNVVKGAGG